MDIYDHADRGEASPQPVSVHVTAGNAGVGPSPLRYTSCMAMDDTRTLHGLTPAYLLSPPLPSTHPRPQPSRFKWIAIGLLLVAIAGGAVGAVFALRKPADLASTRCVLVQNDRHSMMIIYSLGPFSHLQPGDSPALDHLFAFLILRSPCSLMVLLVWMRLLLLRTPRMSLWPPWRRCPRLVLPPLPPSLLALRLHFLLPWWHCPRLTLRQAQVQLRLAVSKKETAWTASRPAP